TTGTLETIRKQIKASRPGSVNFMIGNSGTKRALFAVPDIMGIQWNQQTGTAPTFTASAVPVAALGVSPGHVAAIAVGSSRSPDSETPEKFIPVVPTLFGQPRPQGANNLVFEIFVPSSAKPAGGWPVAIFGHGFTDSMYGAPWTVAAML